MVRLRNTVQVQVPKNDIIRVIWVAVISYFPVSWNIHDIKFIVLWLKRAVSEIKHIFGVNKRVFLWSKFLKSKNLILKVSKILKNNIMSHSNCEKWSKNCQFLLYYVIFTSAASLKWKMSSLLCFQQVNPYFFFYSLVKIHIPYPRFLWECTLSFRVVSSTHRNKRRSYWVLIRMDQNNSSVIMWVLGSEDKHMKHVTRVVFHIKDGAY